MSLLSLMEIFWWCLSPYGVLLSKCIKLQWNSELRERGSVPSRGLSYLNECMTISEFSKIVVSVPSRGLSYLNEILSMMDETGEVVSVPSRGLSYLNSSSCWLSSSSFSSFRPLTGTLLSKLILSALSTSTIFVSVPSRGLSYLNIHFL